MKRGALSFLNLVHWPIWLKIAGLVGGGLLVLALPAFLTIRATMLESGLESARNIIELDGIQHAGEITNFIESAQADLQTAASSATIRPLMIRLLLQDAGERLGTPVDSGDVSDLLAAELLDPATTSFENIRLLTLDGTVVAARSLADNSFGNIVGAIQTRSPAYRAAVAAVTAGLSRTIIASQVGDDVTLESVETVYRLSGETAGYIIARFNPQAIAATLITEAEPFPHVSFLASDQGILFRANESVRGAVEPSVSTGVTRALGGRTDVERYTLGNGTEVFGYFAPLAGGRLAFVTEVTVAAVEEEALSAFTTRAFVLTAGFVGLFAIMIGALVTLNQLITPPLGRLRMAAQALTQGDFTRPVPDSTRQDEIGALAASFVVMREQVQGLVTELQERLEARARDIDTTQAISRFAATQSDLQTLMDRVVNLIVERFENIYHAQIFLIDAEGEYAVLRASTGEVGQLLLARGHRLALGSVSVIGQATSQRRVVLARDTAYSEVHRRNELLPDTRAELALPLYFGDRIIGALDVQSTERDTFTEEQINVLQTVANQIAVAIQTASLYEQSVRRLEQIEQANRMATLRAWQEYMRGQRVREMQSRAGVDPGADLSTLRQSALTSGQPIIGDPTERQTIPVAVPIQIAGQVIGAVEWELPAADFGEDKVELAKELANRLAITLENARLFQESRRAAERERLVNTIAARLTSQTDVHDILQTAVREVGQALRIPQVSIRLHGAEANGNGNGNGQSKENGNHSNGHHAS